MYSTTPSPFDPSLFGGDGGLEEFVGRYVDDYWLYGSGKVALRDGLAAPARGGENVCVPAYIPDAVAEPIREVGLEVRYCAVDADLSPVLSDVEARIDDDTVAVTSIDYFGFPQPAFGDLRSLADEHGCLLLEDNAHSPLSVHEGNLLGTRGDLGITSLRKLLPVPDGAVLYADLSIANRLEPSSFAEPNARPGARECRYLLSSFVANVLELPLDALTSAGNGAVPPPRERYARTKAPMSKLTRLVAAGIDVERIRLERRVNYRTWRRVLEGRQDVRLLFERLPEGICPQVCPVRAEGPETFLSDLERAGLGCAHTWPRLPEEVLGDPAYSVAVGLADRIVLLPVHRGVDVERIEAVGRRLRSGGGRSASGTDPSADRLR